jgi:HD superfamily phosphohydrolase
VEEKGIYSIEKFLVARRLMYWQVYLHKTVLCAEQMLQQIIKRAKYIKAFTKTPLNKFINEPIETVTLEEFCQLDDYDVMSAIKEWCTHGDTVLSLLCRGIIDRQLLKIKYFGEPVDANLVVEKTNMVMEKYSLNAGDAGWLAFTGEAVSNTYNFEDENIHILFKDGSVKDISAVDNALINQNMKSKVKKYYICYSR